MFKLTDELPTKIEVDGVIYPINMAFDNILRLSAVMNDMRLTDVQQLMYGISMLFKKPLNMEFDKQAEVFKEVYEKLLGQGEESAVTYDLLGNPMPVMESEEAEKKYFDIEQDAEYIYASFMQDYGIDLFKEQGKLHWYKFKALLGGLSDTSKISRIIEIRKMPLPSGKGSEEQRKQVIKLKKTYALKGVSE